MNYDNIYTRNHSEYLASSRIIRQITTLFMTKKDQVCELIGKNYRHIGKRSYLDLINWLC